MYNLDDGGEDILPMPEQYSVEGNAVFYRWDGISINSAPDHRAGIEFIAPLKDQNLYTISFWRQGNTPVTLKLFRIKNGVKTIELEHGV